MLVVMVIASSGATCDRLGRGPDPLAPAAFVAPPSLEEILYAVNANTDRVQSLQADSVSLATPGLPSLRASLALERPRRFRLRGSLLGPELDVGSNDDIFWFWAKNDPSQAVYFGRHDEFHLIQSRSPIPVQPTWFIDALGLVTLDPSAAYEGPFFRNDGRIEIRYSDPETPSQRRVVVIDGTYGWIVEQKILDSAGQVLASIQASAHRFYPSAGLSLPHHLAIEFAPAELSFTIDVRSYSINPFANVASDQLWLPPTQESQRWINLADPGLTHPMHPQERPTRTEGPSAYRPQYRGYTRRR